VLFELDAEPLQARPVPEYREVSRFPAVVRDLAVVVPEATPVQALLDALSDASVDAVQGIRLFDVYRGKGIDHGRKSLAFRVVMQHTGRTLTDGEVDAAMAKLTQVLASRFGARLRA
jgi:phenylalanyl-tRNA synthetase beta chain